jgi:hypothetical protein
LRLNARQFDPALREAVSRACVHGDNLTVGLHAVATDELESALTALRELLSGWQQCVGADAAGDGRIQVAARRMAVVDRTLVKVGLDTTLLHSPDLLAGAGDAERGELSIVVREVKYQIRLAAQALEGFDGAGAGLPAPVADWARLAGGRTFAEAPKVGQPAE